MNISYLEFMKIVPEGTKKYVNKVINYLYYYVIKDRYVKFKNSDNYYDSNTIRVLTSMMAAMQDDNEYKQLISQSTKVHNLDIKYSSFSSIELNESERENIFNRFSKYFCYQVDDCNYKILKPIHILRNIFLIALKDSSYDMSNFLNELGISNNYKEILNRACDDEKNQREISLEKEVYGELNASVITYIELASKVRVWLLTKLRKDGVKENDFLKPDDDYLVPLSLLIALFYCKGEYTDEIRKYLSINKIGFDNLNSLVIGNNDFRYAFNNSRDLNSIKMLYMKYFTEGHCKDKDKDKITIIDIVENLFDRSFSNSIVIDKLLLAINPNISSQIVPEGGFINYFRVQSEKEKNDYAKSFYKELKGDTREFINFASKAYILILDKMKGNKHNSFILGGPDDADTLSLYIASHFYGSELEDYYVEHGVTFDKVMSLLGLSITREEIDNVPLDSKITVDIFKRFVDGGINQNRKHDSIEVIDVVKNLYRRDFNRSMIMESIFEEINKEIDLPADFSKTISSYFEEKERLAKKNEIEVYFKDKSTDYYNYITSACRIFHVLKYTSYPSVKDLSDEDCAAFALLYAYKYNDFHLCGFLDFLGITDASLNKVLSKNYVDRNNYAFDIDVVKSLFSKYIFEGRNKDKKIITEDDILFNIFNKELHQSIWLTSFLTNCNLTYDSFNDLSEFKKAYEVNQEQKRIDDAYKKRYSINKDSVSKLLEEASSYVKFVGYALVNKGIEVDTDSLEFICIILALFNSKDKRVLEVFDKYNITKLGVLNYFNLTDLNLDNIPKVNVSEFLNGFDTYFNPESNIHDISGLIKVLFINNKDLTNAFCAYFGTSYDVLYTELVDRKDYIEVLTVEDRTKLLERNRVETLDYYSTNSVLNFGAALQSHAVFINDTFGKVISDASTRTETEDLSKVISGVCIEEKEEVKKLSWFDKIFGAVEETPKTHIRIDDSALSNLKDLINNKLSPLYTYVSMEDELGKYMETYRKKNLEYIDTITVAIEEVKRKLDSININDNYGEYLRIKTCLSALERKKEVFLLTDQLTRQNIAAIYLSMQSLLDTVVGLEISRDALIPLIGTGVVIGKGIETNVDGKDINRQVITLLNDIVKKNSDGIRTGMKELEEPLLLSADMKLLSDNLTSYVELLESHRKEIDAVQNTAMLPELIASNDTVLKDEFKVNSNDSQKKKTLR